MSNQFLLKTHLEAMVPLAIQVINDNGGITDEHINRARRIAWEIAEHGDIILYKSDKKGESARVVNELVEGLAVLSFCPGGVRFMGLHFEAKRAIL
jgi:hypothetical protein